MLTDTASEALQAVERLCLGVKRNKDSAGEVVFKQCVDTLDNLRGIKSRLEGSEVRFEPPDLSDAILQDLRQLTLMHIPASLTDNVREKFHGMIVNLLAKESVEVVCAVLLTCPWYFSTQKERGEQAKHNQLFIVYKSSNQRFLAPVNAHIVDQTNVVDKGWLYVCELFHFVQFLAKGKTREVEVVYSPQQAVIFQSDMWPELRAHLPCHLVLGLKNFREACKGQSIGGIGKKGKDGRFRMKDTTTFRELCDSFRLMHHLYNAANKLPPCTEEFENGGTSPSMVMAALDILRSMYQNPDVSKKDAFNLLVEWKNDIESGLSKVVSKPEDVQQIVGSWHMKLRLRGAHLTPMKCPSDAHSHLVSLMETVGGPVTRFSPDQILMITQAGSYMYGLSTASSDVDYVIIYTEKTETLLTACKRLPQIVENRGPKLQIEYGAYESACFAEMLLKGSVVMLELVFKDDHNYVSPAWEALASRKNMFVTEKGIQQYMGLIKNNFHMIKNCKRIDLPQERKMFYQIYHKMDSLQYFLQGVPPPVTCTGEVRDFIMKVRTQPLEGELHRDALYKDAMTKFEKLNDDFAARPRRLHENCDFNFLVDWIMTIRGMPKTEASS